MVIHTSDDQFEKEVLQSPTPVLVDFWAPWCGPCRMVGPVIDKVAEKYAGKVKTVKVNVDESPGAARRHNVHAIPTIMMFVSGNAAERVTGFMPEKDMCSMIDKHITADK